MSRPVVAVTGELQGESIHDRQVWCDIMSQLVLSGYEGAICIEHEDSLMSSEEGLEKAVEFLKDVIIKSKKPGGLFWA